MSGGEQKVLLGLRNSQAQEVEDEHDPQHMKETKDAFYEYVFSKAARDSRLGETETATLRQVKEELVSSDEVHTTEAADLGRRLATIGDEVDAIYHEEMEEIVQMTGTPEVAYSVFVDVVKQLFEWDESTGKANITIGRLGALLAYAYHLCKHYIQTNAKVSMVISFVGLVATWLFRFLIKAKFYDWLESMGGWGNLITNATGRWGNTLFLVIGVTSLVIWSYNFFKSR